MSGNLVEFLKLYERTSASSGKRYFAGRLNGLRLVGFPVEAKEGQDAHVQLYVDASGDRQKPQETGRREGNGFFQNRNKPAQQYRRGGGRHERDDRSDNPPAPPFTDDIPF